MNNIIRNRRRGQLKRIEDIIDSVGYADLHEFLDREDEQDVLWKLLCEIEDNIKNELEVEESKAYIIAIADNSDFYIPEALHIERNDNLMMVQDDEQASKIAIEDGIELIKGMHQVQDDIYIDTKENRKIIIEMLNKYPQYVFNSIADKY